MRHRAPRKDRRQLAAGWLAALGIACLTAGLAWPPSASQAGAAPAAEVTPSTVTVPTTRGPTATVGTAQTAATAETSVTTRAGMAAASATRSSSVAPVLIRIPSIGVSAPLDRLGLQQDRTVQVPDDPMHAGWYRLGPAPGRSGSAVILGHVSSAGGPAVFGRLQELDPGDRVHVEAPDGATVTFEVIRLATYPNAEFPAARVYADSGDEVRLNLVTCGGRYTRETGHLANLVVYTRLVDGA